MASGGWLVASGSGEGEPASESGDALVRTGLDTWPRRRGTKRIVDQRGNSVKEGSMKQWLVASGWWLAGDGGMG